MILDLIVAMISEYIEPWRKGFDRCDD